LQHIDFLIFKEQIVCERVRVVQAPLRLSQSGGEKNCRPTL